MNTCEAMNPVDVVAAVDALPHAWKARPLGRVGTASVKALRMSELPLAEERHAAAEALLVLDGRLELSVAGEPVSVGPGEIHWVPAGVRHAVRPGSHGTLVILEEADD
ncbi:cupin domain-containing protein [Streptomyces inhibens]|uniref:cupin domain-containing protein n=1 Tax=Streptomyces inhibens TaxID=2293571 RepID=UPI001EE72A82|nr:cupin domain-containing protein [Streptomyces inhibens]UKY51321.1 cupin domain-containing protein [Streptomyces inhibens]